MSRRGNARTQAHPDSGQGTAEPQPVLRHRRPEQIAAQLFGRIVLTLKTAWADGTRQLVFEPLELLEKLAALTPRPRVNLVLYHGVLAPHSSWRARVVASGAPPVEPRVATSASPEVSDEPTTAPVWRHWAWADLMRRAFDIDVLACPALRWALAFDCHGRRPRRDSRDPGRWYRVARAGGSGAPVRAGAEHQPRRGDRRMSASGRRLRRGLFGA